MKFKSKEVQVKISRSAQFAPVIRVFEHEVPILEIVHGDGTVAVLPHGKGKPIVREFDHDMERQRLVSKYPPFGNPRVIPVEAVYGNKVNSTLGRGRGRQQDVEQQEAAA